MCKTWSHLLRTVFEHPKAEGRDSRAGRRFEAFWDGHWSIPPHLECIKARSSHWPHLPLRNTATGINNLADSSNCSHKHPSTKKKNSVSFKWANCQQKPAADIIHLPNYPDLSDTWKLIIGHTWTRYPWLKGMVTVSKVWSAETFNQINLILLLISITKSEMHSAVKSH